MRRFLIVFVICVLHGQEVRQTDTVNVWPGIVRKVQIQKHDVSTHEVITMELDTRHVEDPNWRLVLKIWLETPQDMARFLGKHILLETSTLPYNPSDSLERPDTCKEVPSGEPCRLEKLESVKEISDPDPVPVVSYRRAQI